MSAARRKTGYNNILFHPDYKYDNKCYKCPTCTDAKWGLCEPWHTSFCKKDAFECMIFGKECDIYTYKVLNISGDELKITDEYRKKIQEAIASPQTLIEIPKTMVKYKSLI